MSEEEEVTLNNGHDEESFGITRHSFPYLIWHTFKPMFPSEKMAIGPVIDNGFYYDIEYERPFTPEDVTAIEKRVQQLIKTDYDVIKKMTPIKEAREIFVERDETYKVELIDDLIERGETAVGLYHHEEYIDMCRGPHVPNTRVMRIFKLMRVSGAY